MSYDGTLKFDVEIDTSDLEKELAKLQETISGVKFDSLFSSINEGVSQSSGIVSTLTDSVKTLGSGFEGVGKSLGSNLLGEVLKGGDAIGEFASKVTTNLGGIATSALATGGAMLAINAAVGLVSWGISALVEHFSKVDAETQKLRDEISGLAAEHESLNASITTTKETMDGNVTAAIANAEAAQTLVGQMREMAAAGDTGAGSQARLQDMVAQTNGLLGEEALAYNEVTGEVEGLDTMTGEYFENLKQQTMAQAYLETYTEMLKQQTEATINRAIAQEKLNSLEKTMDGDIDMTSHTEEYQNLQEVITGYDATLLTLGEDTAIVEGLMSDAYQGMTTGAQGMAEGTGQAAQAMTEQQAAMADAVSETLNRVAQAYYDSNSKIDLSNAETLAGRIENITENQRLSEEYAANMALLGEKVGDELDAGLLAELQRGDAEAMALAQQMVTSLEKDDGQWEELNNHYKESATAALTALGEGMVFPEGADPGAGAMQEIVDSLTMDTEPMRAAGTEARAAYDEGFATGAGEETAVQAETLSASISELTAEFETMGSDAGTAYATGMMTALGEGMAGTGEETAGAGEGVLASISGLTAEFETMGSDAGTAYATGMMTALGEGMVFPEEEDPGTVMVQGIADGLALQTETLREAFTDVMGGVTEALTTSAEENILLAGMMMTGMAERMTIGGAELELAAVSAKERTKGAFASLVTDGADAVRGMMAGMLTAMNDGAASLYEKAREIANTIAQTLRAAWDEHSPSKVFYRIGAYAMEGLYEGLAGGEGMLYRKAGELSEGILQRLRLSGSITPELSGRVLAAAGVGAVDARVHQSAFAPAVAAAAPSYQTSLTQYITAPKPLRESELTQEAENMLRRGQWKIP